MHSIYPGKEQPYPPQMKRYLDPVLLWTVAATATSRVRLRRQPRSRQNVETMKCGSVGAMPPQSTVEQFD